jgi:hypothetical protein
MSKKVFHNWRHTNSCEIVVTINLQIKIQEEKMAKYFDCIFAGLLKKSLFLDRKTKQWFYWIAVSTNFFLTFFCFSVHFTELFGHTLRRNFKRQQTLKDFFHKIYKSHLCWKVKFILHQEVVQQLNSENILMETLIGG